jgi:hypothetical protein
VHYLSAEEKKKLDVKSAESDQTNELMLVGAFAVGMGSIMSKVGGAATPAASTCQQSGNSMDACCYLHTLGCSLAPVA